MFNRIAALLAALAFTLSAGAAVSGQAQSPDPTRYEDDILAFERTDAEKYPPPGCAVFTGSSSIRGWRTLREDFAEMDVVNRGFGGSHISDCIHYAPRIVVQYHPTAVVLYAGDNDVAGGKSAETVLADFREFVRTVHGRIGPRAIYFVSIKPSLARWELWPEMQRANELVRGWAAEQDAVYYIDIATPMLGEDGKPRPELFVEDGLHLNEEGYELWTEAVKPEIERED
jgi:lysophospholipase L1-like esterase